jgi:formamidopyrimidine-DNA glycosylase
MPEIPDLVIFRDNLNKMLKGKTLENIESYDVKGPQTEDLKQALKDQKLKEIIREGKELHFHFANKHILALHLMLTGKLKLEKTEKKPGNAVVLLQFEPDIYLYVVDRPGYIRAFLKLDPEPSEVPDVYDEAFTYKFFAEKLDKHKKMAIKSLMTDGKIIRGLGNAYVDEILWESKVSPMSKAGNLPEEVAKTIYKNIRKVLDKAEKYIRSVSPDTINDKVRDFLSVHNYKKTETPTGYPIIRAKVGGRDTFYTEEQVEY